jgi:hypothetical protein
LHLLRVRIARSNDGSSHRAPALVGQADDGSLGDGRIAVEDLLDLGGGRFSPPRMIMSLIPSTIRQ